MGAEGKTWSVCMRMWGCSVCILGGRCSGICGGTSYGETSNPSVEWKIWTYNMNTVKL